MYTYLLVTYVLSTLDYNEPFVDIGATRNKRPPQLLDSFTEDTVMKIRGNSLRAGLNKRQLCFGYGSTNSQPVDRFEAQMWYLSCPQYGGTNGCVLVVMVVPPYEPSP